MNPRALSLLALTALATLLLAQTTSSPATQPILTSGKFKLSFQLYQDNKPLSPDAKGLLHLKPAPFEIRFTGDPANAAILATPKLDLATALAKEKSPILYFAGQDATFSPGDLLLDSEAKLATWAEFKATLPENDAEMYANIFAEHFPQKTPTFLQAHLQLLSAKPTDKSFILKIERIPKSDFTKTKSLTLTILLTAPVDDQFFKQLTPQSLQLQFDQ